MGAYTVSQDKALKMMLVSQHYWISRLEVMPLEYANRMIFSKMAGS